jgi:hypothetical protein
MADIRMTQVRGTTHHFYAMVDVDPSNLEPTVDLALALDYLGNTIKIDESIRSDLRLEDIIFAFFKAESSSVTGCIFKPDSLTRNPITKYGIAITIVIETSALVVEPNAMKIEFEFQHTLGR